MVVKAISVLCAPCVKWIHSKCAGVKWVTPKFSGNFTCRKCKGNPGEVVVEEEKLCDEVKTAGEFTHLCDGMSAS